MLNDSLEIFMDDFTPYGATFEDALQNLEKVLKRCIESHLALSTEKCHMMMNEGIVLGHFISFLGIQVDPSKVQVIQTLPIPKTQTDVRIFLGYAGYYRRFINFFSKIASPLFVLMTKNVEFTCTDDCQKAFDELKHQLSTTPILRGPDSALPFHISSYASDTAIGVVLGQEENNLPYAIYFIISAHSPWYADITDYLVAGKLPSHLSHREKRKIIQRSARYSWISGCLFHTGLDQEIWICIREDEVYDILKACHDGPCGGHFADKRTTHKVLRMGYYWPSLFKDAKKYVRACDSCQRMGQPNHRDETPLNPQVILEPFERWALDFIGPINPPSNQRVYILVCTDYMTKWVEAKALIRANEKSILTFLFEEIFVRFGVLRELVTDGGLAFNSHGFKDTLYKYHVNHKMTTPYHPQANGQVESTNKVIEAILTKTVKENRRDWFQSLPEALWAYRNTWRNTTGFSPYELVYGKSDVFLVEFEIKTLRTALAVNLDLTDAQTARLQQLQELDEKRLDAIHQTTMIQHQRTRWHDKTIKHKQFQKCNWATPVLKIFKEN
eukprot:PITA_08569